MVSSSIFVSIILIVLFAILSAGNARPLQKRIAQTIADSTTMWEQACLAAGGADECNPTSITAFTTLLAAAGPCDQQNAGDQMIDLAKTLNNDADMIKFTQIFVQQPRNSPDSFSIPYCQQAPKNEELTGLFQCQFQGVKPEFVGNLQPGAQGTIPFGLTSPVNPAGSCLAHTAGGIADGSQLVDITQDPGVGNASSGGGKSTSTVTATATIIVPNGDSLPFTTGPTLAFTSPVTLKTASACGAAPATTTSEAPGSTSSFVLQNGKDAQQRNSQFESLTANSTCTDNGCVGEAFALCANGNFVLMECGTDLICAALPLVNSPGTSIACTTQQDALSRIAATGATGGLTGLN